MRDNIVIVGSGQMGCGIACCSAIAGNKTLLVDINYKNAFQAISKVKKNIQELYENQLCTKSEADRAMKLVMPCDSLSKACEQASIIIEAIYEDLAAKQVLFEELDSMLPPEIPLLSNTSGLRITDISIKTKHPERTLTAHFWLPAHLMPLVEVVVGDKSSYDLAIRIKDLLSEWGKSPVIVKKDLPGQLANRILQAIIREAVNIVDMGLASAEDVDTSIKMGMALRFPMWGPLEHIDAVGLDLCYNVQKTVLPQISNTQEPIELMSDCLAKGNLGYKTGKGIYDWSEKDMCALVEKRNDFIIHALKKVKKKIN